MDKPNWVKKKKKVIKSVQLKVRVEVGLEFLTQFFFFFFLGVSIFNPHLG